MPPKKKAANGYKFAEPLPKGIILEDIGKKKWILGPSIGKGGFGEIYSAQQDNCQGETYPYVIKIEPHANGPLFVEINFYIRNAKAADIEEFKKKKVLKTFGMPVYYGSGSLEYKGEKYRFLVMNKFSTDLLKLYVDNNKVFPTDTVFKLGLQLIDILEYIHERGYVHADIKAANILLGATKAAKNQVYLVDFGLVSKYATDKEFKPNPKKAHDGTIEFLSRDAHQGVQTRRGDLEILAYNLIQWLGGKLPWEGHLNDPKVVQNSKEEHLTTVSKLIKASFISQTPPKAIVEYLKYIKTLKFNTEPDYKRIENIFISGVKEGGGSIGSPLQFSGSKTPLKRNRTPLPESSNKKTKVGEDEESKVEDDMDKTPKPKKKGRTRKNLIDDEDDAEDNDDEPNNSFVTLRKPKQDISTKRNRAHLQINQSKNSKSNKNEENGKISSDEEEIPKSRRRGRSKKDLNIISEEHDAETAVEDKSDNEVITRIGKRKIKGDLKKEKKGLNRKISRSLNDLRDVNEFDGYTDAMKEIVLKRKKAGGTKVRVNLNKEETLPKNENNDDMGSFSDEVKAIAVKKKSKVTKTSPTAVPIATKNKASDKRGLVKPKIKRLQKKTITTHGNLLRHSDGSASD